MRRSIDFDFMNDNEGRKQFKFFSWFFDSYNIDIEDVRTIWNFDAYIYVSYLKMSAQFFAVLSILNIMCFYAHYFIENDYENNYLTILQQMTILSMYNSKTKMMIIYVMTVLNSIAGYIFLIVFLRVFKQFEFQPYHEDYGDYEVSKTTIMIHNIPSYIPVVEWNALLGQIFKSRFKTELEAVHTVGNYDKIKLDRYYRERIYTLEKVDDFISKIFYT